jgi:hypothetical protein
MANFSIKSVQLPRYIKIQLRLYHDLKVMAEFAIETDKEVGGLLIKALHGHLGVIAEQFGKDREIMLKPNEQLYEAELYFGSTHSHPKTEFGSTSDIDTFLADETEQIMVVTGADNSINMYFKTKATKSGEYDVKAMGYAQEDNIEIAEDFGYLFYRAEDDEENILTLQNEKLLDEDIEVLDETWTVERLIDYLGLEGLNFLPQSSMKKTPAQS